MDSCVISTGEAIKLSLFGVTHTPTHLSIFSISSVQFCSVSHLGSNSFISLWPVFDLSCQWLKSLTGEKFFFHFYSISLPHTLYISAPWPRSSVTNGYVEMCLKVPQQWVYRVGCSHDKADHFKECKTAHFWPPPPTPLPFILKSFWLNGIICIHGPWSRKQNFKIVNQESLQWRIYYSALGVLKNYISPIKNLNNYLRVTTPRSLIIEYLLLPWSILICLHYAKIHFENSLLGKAIDVGGKTPNVSFQP